MENSPPVKTILAADDSAVARILLARRLTSAGYQVLTASDGIEAVQQAYRALPDLIILDVTMPRMNGYQVCRLLKRDPLLAPIPVIILTGTNSHGTEFWSLRTKADAFLLKGAEHVELMETVEKLLESSASRTEAIVGSHSALEERVSPGPEEILSKVCALMDEELYATTIERIELKTILQNLQNGVLVFNSGHEVSEANQALCRMLGKEESELLSRPCAEALGERAGTLTLAMFEAAISSNEGAEQNSEIMHSSGHKIPVSIRVLPLHDFLGATVGGICLFHHIHTT